MEIETNETPVDPVNEASETAPETADGQDIDDWDDVPPPPDDLAPEAPSFDIGSEEKTDDDEIDGEEGKAVSEEEQIGEGKTVSEEEQIVQPVARETDDLPDFSKYKTNVAERLWRANKASEKAEVTSSPDLLKLSKEYQDWRTKMGFLNKYIEEYATAMQVASEKRNQLFKQYALMSENTPLWNHIGKPLTKEQMSEMQGSGDLKTPEGIEARTKTIMEVAEEIGPGSLMAFQQLSMMQDELSSVEFQNHNADYIDEWDKVVTSNLDDGVKAVRELSNYRQKYIVKVDKLREKVNTIEHRGKQVAPKKLTDKLYRNERKLAEHDAEYEKKANGVSVLLFEATQRGWVDFYPVAKNVMKFEINRLGRESSCHGSFHTTLGALKKDYRDATKNTADAPNVGSAL